MAQALSPQRQTEVDHAREVDTEVARLWGLFWEVQNQIVANLKSAADVQKRIALYKRQGYQQGIDQAEKDIAYYNDLAEGLMPEAHTRKKAAQDYDAANYDGWTRFFLVKHIHNTMYCPSFRPSTRVGWLPDVSGLTEVEAVKEHGETLCTKCFPSAPVELTVKPLDETTCPGSGKHFNNDHLTGRERSYFSPAGHCSVCDQWVGLTARYSANVRKHKKPVV